MSVNLHIQLPSSETIDIEAEPADSMKVVKERVASLTGLLANRFSLTFDGEEVGDNDDGRLVGSFPFEDQSVLGVAINKVQAALQLLTKLGYEGKGLEHIAQQLRDAPLSDDADASYYEILSAMKEAGLHEECEPKKLKHLKRRIFHALSQLGLTSCAELMLECTGVDVNGKESGSTAIHRNSHMQTVTMLLRHGADVNARDYDNLTSLHHASQEGNNDVLTLLLESGAEVTSVDRDGTTALHMATTVQVATNLLRSGADVNAIDHDGKTALHHSADNADLLSVLLESSAYVDAKDSEGKTALHHTASEAAAAVLIQHGADVNAVDARGRTPLFTLSNPFLASLLLQSSADVNVASKDGSTALHLASIEDVAAELIRYGADVNARTRKGSTPLHLAARSGSRGVVSLLLTTRVAVNAKNKAGKTALDLAKKEEIALDLLRHGADPNMKWAF
eukprot:TRINITY_DN662_c1_g2_i1.p1 TRINITY_DN662_c1_g2~~TRINITY_DN662_c1_g2_i1.p1  ORF type:complete len:472 (+),score=120.62 TRINITY_DN662_c1_g2_i1:66-1418(+)